MDIKNSACSEELPQVVPTMPPFHIETVQEAPPYTAPALEAPSQRLHYHRKQHLYHVGDAAQSIFRLQEGLVRVTRMTPEGRLMTVRHVIPGDFFGEEAFRSKGRAEVAEALTVTTIQAFDPSRINYQDLLTITQSLSSQMQRLMDYEYHLQTGDLRQRVARYLLTLANTPLAEQNDQGCKVIAATHELIAEGTASTRESVSKIITELRSEDLIDSGYRSIMITQADKLHRIAHGAHDDYYDGARA